MWKSRKKPETADEERIGLFLKTAQNKKSNRPPALKGEPVAQRGVIYEFS